MLSVFDQLLHAETFTDVTLAVDGQYLKAHKVSRVWVDRSAGVLEEKGWIPLSGISTQIPACL